MPTRRPSTSRHYSSDNGNGNGNGNGLGRWHVGKEVPIVLIAAVLVQTAGGIWWMAQLSGKLDAAVVTIVEFKSERYTREDARRDRELIEQKMAVGVTRGNELERRINSNDSRVDRLENSRK